MLDREKEMETEQKKLLKLQRDNERQQQLFNRRLTELEHQKNLLLKAKHKKKKNNNDNIPTKRWEFRKRDRQDKLIHKKIYD